MKKITRAEDITSAVADLLQRIALPNAPRTAIENAKLVTQALALAVYDRETCCADDVDGGAPQRAAMKVLLTNVVTLMMTLPI